MFRIKDKEQSFHNITQDDYDVAMGLLSDEDTSSQDQGSDSDYEVPDPSRPNHRVEQQSAGEDDEVDDEEVDNDEDEEDEDESIISGEVRLYWTPALRKSSYPFRHARLSVCPSVCLSVWN